MAGTKRSSAGDETETPPRKAAKTGESKGKGKSKAIPYSTFHARALPIHVNLSHTPAAVIENEEEPTTPSDPGHIAAVILLPSEFTTGSYGWKGSRRLQVELQGAEGKENVTVMLNINATVVGSKGSKDDEKAEDEDEAEKEKEQE